MKSEYEIKTEQEKAIETCMWLAITLALYPIAAIWSSYVFEHLWNWFAVPIFELRSLTMIQSYGVILIVGYIANGSCICDDSRNNEKKFKDFCLRASLFPAMYLLVGSIAKHYL